MIKLFHHHKWEIIKSTYVEPAMKPGMKGENLLNLEHMLTSHTYLTLQCTRCGDIKEMELHGEVDFLPYFVGSSK